MPLQLILTVLYALLAGWVAPAARAAEPPQATIVLGTGTEGVALQGRAQAWIEPGRLKTVEEVAAAGDAIPWQVLQPGYQLRLDDGALWVRFTAEVRGPDRWYLTLLSSGPDRVQLFQRDANGRWQVREAGDSRPVSQWPLPGRVPSFELASGGPATYWLRIEHERVDFAAQMRLVTNAELFGDRAREQFLLGGYFGVAMLLFIVALLNAVAWRDRNFVAYAVYLGLFSLGQAAYLGVGAQHLWDSWLEFNAVSTFLLPGLATAAALWFVQVVTEPARFSVALDRLVTAVVFGIVVLQALEVLLPSRGLFTARLLATTGALVLVALLIWLVWTRGDDPEIRLIALGFLPVLVMALFPIARGLNLIPNSLFTRYGLAIGAAMEMPILFWALSLRAGRRREWHLRARALPRTDALTGLADRRSLLQRLDAALARARSQKQSCALLLVRVANYDHIASDYGRDVLERAMVVAASHLRRLATDIDLAARVGEREFALLVEGPTNADVIASRAQQLVASGLRPTEALPGELTLRLVVVTALLPDEPTDAVATLDWMLDGLAAVRPDARKQIRVLNTGSRSG